MLATATGDCYGISADTSQMMYPFVSEMYEYHLIALAQRTYAINVPKVQQLRAP